MSVAGTITISTVVTVGVVAGAAAGAATAAAVGRKMPRSQLVWCARFTQVIMLTPLALGKDRLIQLHRDLVLIGFKFEFAQTFFNDEGASVDAELADFSLLEIHGFDGGICLVSYLFVWPWLVTYW